jgi:hypothetical protein
MLSYKKTVKKTIKVFLLYEVIYEDLDKTIETFLTSISGYLFIKAFLDFITSISWSLSAIPYQRMFPSAPEE